MTGNTRAERRKEKREMHVDRRKSDLDLIEHIVRGVRVSDIRVTSDDRPARTRSSK